MAAGVGTNRDGRFGTKRLPTPSGTRSILNTPFPANLAAAAAHSGGTIKALMHCSSGNTDGPGLSGGEEEEEGGEEGGEEEGGEGEEEELTPAAAAVITATRRTAEHLAGGGSVKSHRGENGPRRRGSRREEGGGDAPVFTLLLSPSRAPYPPEAQEDYGNLRYVNALIFPEGEGQREARQTGSLSPSTQTPPRMDGLD